MPENIIRIGNTPLSISVYSVREKALEMHDPGMLEIIFCLRGTVTFSYAYEEFNLRGGEYVSVDKDAYYLYSDRDNMCVSFYIDLTAYEEKYPNIKHQLFVCEGCNETTMAYPTEHHNRLRGKLITLLRLILDTDSGAGGDGMSRIAHITGSIVDMFAMYFDIVIFHSKKQEMDSETLERFWEIDAFMNDHFREKVTLEMMASHMGLSPGYLSEFMLKTCLGFRRMLAYIRANKSEWFLINTDMTIVEISEECGFSDPQYYYKAFKEWYRCTPRQFREKYVRRSNDDIVYYEPWVIRNIVEEMMVDHYVSMFEE